MKSVILIKYPNINNIIIDGIFLSPLQTSEEPIVTYNTTDTNTSTSTKYTLIMYDSKSVSLSKNHNHWLVINIPSEDLKTGNLNRSNILLSYKGPAPPSGSGEHIYNFELYKQNSNLDKIVMDEDDRIISLNDIKSKIGIQSLKPVSSVFFYSKYTNTFGGSNIKKNIKRKTIKKTRKSKKSKKVRYIKR